MEISKLTFILICNCLIFQTKISSAQNWKAVPLVTQSMLNKGLSGGEGCQVVQSIEIDQIDGAFLLMGTDVGGIYRSINGGKTWEPCNTGYHPRGNAGFAIDPNNNNRALAVGGNSTNNQSHGIYLTTNKGTNWKPVLQVTDYNGYRGFKDKIDFFRGSFDSGLRFSKIGYFSCPSGGIYKTENGGESWTKINTSFGDCLVKIHPEKGFVYVANNTGFYKSTDGGLTFIKKSSETIVDIDLVYSAPNSVFMATKDKFFKSVDAGESFVPIALTGFPSMVATLNVSSADTNYMAVCNKLNSWGGPIYYSQNGGKNWAMALRNNLDAFMPYNDRLQKFAWHPIQKNKLWALGGDWISSSTDGGKNFSWDANGFNGILVGGFFNFNISNPDLLFVASQDYNGAFTKDNGKTWRYCNASNLGWGGFTYGAYAANENVLVTQNSPEWNQDGKLTISRNGGISFTNTPLLCSGLDVGCGDPKDPNVIYFSNYYSKDLGTTWNEMKDCMGVLIANIYGEKEVYGAFGKNVVKSNNKGDSWIKVVTLSSDVEDIAIDHVLNRLYVVTSGNRLFQFDNNGLKEITSLIPKDQYNGTAIQTVAVDPNDPSIVYCAGAKNIYKTDASVKRSMDAGKTWEIITPNPRTSNDENLKDGANEVFAIRVNPSTRELWAAGGCYGIWKEAGIKSLTIQLSEPSVNQFYSTSGDLVIKPFISLNSDPVLKVEFFSNNIKIGESSTAPFFYVWNKPLPGSYNIQAKITDTSGKTATTPFVPVEVKVSIPPQISLTEPLSNRTFKEGVNIVISANASDVDGTVVKVEFYAGTVKIGEDFTEPFSVEWINSLSGEYSLTAVATDNTGTTRTSSPLLIQINSSGLLTYTENFNDNLAQNWKPGSGVWIGENNQLHHTSTDGIDLNIYEGSTFFNFTFSARIKPEWNNNYGMVFNYIDSKNHYRLELDANPLKTVLFEIKNGTEKKLAEASYTGGGSGIYSTIKIINNGKTTSVEINGVVVFSNIPTTTFSFGKIGLYAWWQPIWYDDIQIVAAANLPTLNKKEPDYEKTISVWPNPYIEGNLNIQFAEIFKNPKIEIFGTTGQRIFSETFAGMDLITLPENLFLENGLYLLKLSSKNESFSKKILYKGKGM